MGLIRSGSTKSTLSMMQRRATRYEQYITLSSIFLIVTSTTAIFTSVVLIRWYFMPFLYFWHAYYVVAPYMLLALGIYKFLVAIYGFIAAVQKNRALLVVFSLLLVIGFIGQLASIFLFWQLRTEIQLGSLHASQIQDQLMLYGSDPKITKNWDYIQQHLSCCGGFKWDSGYYDYKSTPIGRNESVPDSCCINGNIPGCGNNAFQWNAQQIQSSIYIQGCIEILQKWLLMDVEPMIGVYTATGVSMALIEIIAVVLSSAYVAQITRRHLREEIMWYTVSERKKDYEEYDSLQQPPTTNELSSCNDTEV